MDSLITNRIGELHKFQFPQEVKEDIYLFILYGYPPQASENILWTLFLWGKF